MAMEVVQGLPWARALLWLIFILGMPSTLESQGQFQANQDHKIDGEVVNMWGSKFGKELWESLTVATRRDTIQKGYDDHPNIQVEKIDGLMTVRRMAIEVQIMMQHKIDAIKRIMELAENIALDHKYDKTRGERLKSGRYTYYNAKKTQRPQGR